MLECLHEASGVEVTPDDYFRQSLNDLLPNPETFVPDLLKRYLPVWQTCFKYAAQGKMTRINEWY